MNEQISRLIKWSKPETSTPYSIEIHPTNLCNLNCLMCGTRYAYRQKIKEKPSFKPEHEIPFEITKERWLKLVDEAYKLNVKKWLITGGGEPMLRKYITLSLIKKIKDYGMYGNMNTNGALFTMEDAEKVVLSEWDMIMFSIDGVGKTHDFIRNVPGTFDKVFKTMMNFKNLKKKYKKNNPQIIFNSVIKNKNYNALSDIIKLSHKVGCQDITFIPLIKFGEFGIKLDLSENEKKAFEKSLPSLIKLAAKYDINTNLESFSPSTLDDTSNMDKVIMEKSKKEKGFLAVPCYEPFLNLVIRMDGKISPCCMLVNHEENIKNKSLKEIWQGNYFTGLREQLRSEELPQGCKTCVHSQFMHNQELREELRNHIL